MICHINLAKGFRGGERQTSLLVNALSQKISQTVMVRKNSGLAHHLKGLDRIRVVEVEKPFFLNIAKLRPYSLIHAHEAKAAHMAFAAGQLYSTPYIITRRVMKKPKNAFFFKRVHTRARTVVAISSQVEKSLYATDPDIVTQVIPSSFSRLDVDDKEIERLQKKYDKKFIVGHVGALVNKDKGQVHIIRAAKKIKEKYPDIHFLFLGEGRDREWFTREAGASDNITFAGFKKNIGDYFALFDLFLFPSLDEGLGSSILDAFYAGLPVIATRVGGIPDLIESGKNGLLIPRENENEIFKAVETIYKNPEFSRRLAQNGRKTLDRFDIKRTSAQYLSLYNKLSNKLYDPENKTVK